MIDKLTGQLRQKRGPEHLPWEDGLSTGSTLLNLACSGRADVGLLPGHFYYLVGDTSSGKTWVTMSLFAEASINPKYKDHRFIHDNAENGALMDVRKFFGAGVADRLGPPAGTVEGPMHSATVEAFGYNVVAAFDAGKPFIYVLDSMDAVETEAEQQEFEDARKAHAKGKAAGGTYGLDKAKKNSRLLRTLVNRLSRDGRSILVIVSQTRDRIGFGAQYDPKTRAGGRALTFYSSLEIWTSVAGHRKKTVCDKQVEQGIVCRARVRKGRLAGKDRTVEFPIYHSMGLDDLGSCVDYLVEWKHWKEAKGRIEAVEFGFIGTAEKLVRQIEAEGREGELRQVVAQVWGEIEAACAVERKPRYQG